MHLSSLCAYTALCAIGAHAQFNTRTTQSLSNPALPPVSYSYSFTVTTPTTAWAPPTFATPSPGRFVCSDGMCSGGGTTLDHQTCYDGDGVTWGVLCGYRFSGLVITSSGMKKRSDEIDVELETRAYSGSYDLCADFCNGFEDCIGVQFSGGDCMAYVNITGTFEEEGTIAALKQVDGAQQMTEM